MKKISVLFLFIALMISGAVFHACQKEVADQPEAALVMLKNGCSLTFAPEQPVLNEPVTITADALNRANCGWIMLQFSYDQVNWTQMCKIPVVNGQITYEWTPTQLGDVWFRLKYQSSGKGCNYSNLQFSACGVKVITVLGTSCPPATELLGKIMSGTDLLNGWWEFTIKYTFVSAEGGLTGVKTQGGLTAGGKDGAVLGVISTQNMELKTLNKNYVIAWTDDVPDCGIKEYWVTYQRRFTGAGFVTGQWTSKIKVWDDVLMQFVDITLGTCPPLYWPVP